MASTRYAGRYHDAMDADPAGAGAPRAGTVEVNGRSVALVEGTTLAALLVQIGVDGKRVAVERNRTLTPRARWAETVLVSGDRLEIFEFVGGG